MKKLITKTIFALLGLVMLAFTANVNAQTPYGLKVAGVEVTSANAGDLTVIPGVSVASGGAVTYNHTNQTLTLNKATITPSSSAIGIENISIDGLTIVLTDANQITTTSKASCSVSENTEISGNGSLSLSATNECGIYITSNTTLTIKDCNITASGKWGISGYNGTLNENLVIDNATVNATGSDGSIVDLASLTLNGCAITAPQGAEFDNTLHAVALNGTKVTQQVVIEPPYGLKVAGVEVTSANAGDLTVIEGVNVANGGAVTYDHTTKTLTLNKATITTQASNATGIYNYNIDGLKIVLIGENQITTNASSCAVAKNTEISGSGSLSLSSTDNCAIYIKNNTTLTIKDCNITASGKWGIAGYNGTLNENLVIDNATVNATGSDGSIVYLASLTLNGCAITAPQGAAFDNTLHAVALNGTKVTQQVVIEPPYGLKVAGVEVTSANAGDLTVIPGVSVASGGAVTYNHTNQTLTLNKATITPSSSAIGIENISIDGLTIVLTDANQITTTSKASCSVSENTEISGNGSLSLSATNECGIYITSNTTLTIKDCNITASGKWGISGYNGTLNENLVIDNATVNATGSDGSIVDLASLTLNGCAITAPQGAAFDNTLHAVALNGTKVTQQVVIEPSTTNIDEVKTTNVFTFYPNPAQDMVTIELSNSYTGMLQIADISGKIVVSRPIDGTRTSVDISTLSKGIYLVKVGSQVEKLVKQ